MLWIRRTAKAVSGGITIGKLYPVVECYPNGGYLIINDLGKEYVTLGSSMLWEVIGSEVGEEDNAKQSVHRRETLSDSR